jgi:tRNA threonylcarbamoyladenosine biosynthesis protein TsaE
MNETRFRDIEGESAMIALGRSIAARLSPTDLVFVRGDLGAGKTTLIRGILAGLGHQRAVPSPTFTLLEPYHLDGIDVVHMDLYRLKEPEELEMLGVRDFVGDRLCLVEWPERAGDALPAPDVEIDIDGSGGASRSVTLRESSRQ